jgi:hypothetical protein
MIAGFIVAILNCRGFRNEKLLHVLRVVDASGADDPRSLIRSRATIRSVPMTRSVIASVFEAFSGRSSAVISAAQGCSDSNLEASILV